VLGDVRGGKIDVIVVYKVDRLTCSLADFAKLVEACRFFYSLVRGTPLSSARSSVSSWWRHIWRRPSSRDVAATTTRHDCYGWASAESRSCHRSMPVRHDGLNEQKFGAK
jgi:hypothetical protein